MNKAEAGKIGGQKRSERKRLASAKSLAAARLAQARKLLGLDAAPVQPRLPLLLITPPKGKP